MSSSKVLTRGACSGLEVISTPMLVIPVCSCSENEFYVIKTIVTREDLPDLAQAVEQANSNAFTITMKLMQYLGNTKSPQSDNG